MAGGHQPPSNRQKREYWQTSQLGGHRTDINQLLARLFESAVNFQTFNDPFQPVGEDGDFVLHTNVQLQQNTYRQYVGTAYGITEAGAGQTFTIYKPFLNDWYPEGGIVSGMYNQASSLFYILTPGLVLGTTQSDASPWSRGATQNLEWTSGYAGAVDPLTIDVTDSDNIIPTGKTIPASTKVFFVWADQTWKLWGYAVCPTGGSTNNITMPVAGGFLT